MRSMKPARLNRRALAAQIKETLREEYNLKIPAKTIQTVLQALEDCVTHNLLAGNRIVLCDFVTFETVQENGRPLNFEAKETLEGTGRSKPKLTTRVKISRTYKRKLDKILRESQNQIGSK